MGVDRMTAAQLAISDPPAVAHDRFPVAVLGPVEVPTARVIVAVPTEAGGPARVLVWASPGPPLLDQPVDLTQSMFGSPMVDWSLATPGGSLVVRRGRGCGCGNALKHWVPWTPYRMGVLPS